MEWRGRLRGRKEKCGRKGGGGERWERWSGGEGEGGGKRSVGEGRRG